jgi:hypothetical protein
MTVVTPNQVGVVLAESLPFCSPQITQAVNQAFVLHPGGSFHYEQRAIPTLRSERDVLVRIIATGLCGSDVGGPLRSWSEIACQH